MKKYNFVFYIYDNTNVSACQAIKFIKEPTIIKSRDNWWIVENLFVVNWRHDKKGLSPYIFKKCVYGIQ